MVCRRTLAFAEVGAIDFLRAARRLFLVVVVCIGLGGSGCTRVTLADDVDLKLDWNPLVGPSSALNSPYVEGSAMRIYVNSSDNGERYVGWRVTSSAPNVFAVEPLEIDSTSKPPLAWVRGRALSPGSADIAVYDENDQYVGGDLIEVQRPDEIRLLSPGMLLVGFSEDESRVSELRILEHGTATYLARYYHRGSELHGNGALGLSTPGTPIGQPVSGTATVEHSYIFEDRDWLQLTPQTAGSADVGISINGAPFGSFRVIAVPTAEVATIRILNEDESSANRGDWLVSYAQAVDKDDRAITGVEYTWQLDRTMQPGSGDLFRYEYDGRQPKMLTASFSGMAAQVFVHAKKGFVDTTNRVGCRAVPGSHQDGVKGATVGAAVLCALIALRGLRRRRVRAA